jgi:hypothetical protein
MKYLSLEWAIITLLPYKNAAKGQCLVGSLTGAIDSYNATELYKGWLALNRNQSDSANA